MLSDTAFVQVNFENMTIKVHKLSISSSKILLPRTQLLVTTSLISNYEAYSSPGKMEFAATTV